MLHGFCFMLYVFFFWFVDSGESNLRGGRKRKRGEKERESIIFTCKYSTIMSGWRNGESGQKYTINTR